MITMNVSVKLDIMKKIMNVQLVEMDAKSVKIQQLAMNVLWNLLIIEMELVRVEMERSLL